MKIALLTSLLVASGIATGCSTIQQAHLERICSKEEEQFISKMDKELLAERAQILDSISTGKPLPHDRGSMRSFEQNMEINISDFNHRVIKLQERAKFFGDKCKGRV